MATSLSASTREDIVRCKVTPCKNRFVFLSPAELCNSTGGLPAPARALPGSCAEGSHPRRLYQGVPPGPRHLQAPPAVTALSCIIHRSS